MISLMRNVDFGNFFPLQFLDIIAPKVYSGYYVRKILGRPTIWKYNYKMLLKNIESERKIANICWDTQTEYLIIFYRVFL